MKPLSRVSALLILIPCAMLHAFGMDIFASDVPAMVESLATTPEAIQFILIVFMLGTGVGQPFVGILCDKYGRRLVMMAAVFVFCMGSVLSAHANSVGQLTLYRFMQGLGASGTLVATYAIVNDSFKGRLCYQMFSLIAAAISLTPMLAPMLGVGLITLFMSWQACFYFLAGFSLLALTICHGYLPETKPNDTLTPQLATLLSHYMLILRNKAFLLYTLCATLALTELYLYFSVGNLLLIRESGVSEFTYAVLFGSNALVFLVGNLYSTLLQRRYGVRQIAMGGVWVIMLGSLMMSLVYEFVGLTAVGIVVPNGVMTFGVGLMMGPVTGAALQPFKRLAGTASGLFATLQYGGAAAIGFVATRFGISSAFVISIPLFIVSLLTVTILLRSKANVAEEDGELDWQPVG